MVRKTLEKAVYDFLTPTMVYRDYWFYQDMCETFGKEKVDKEIDRQKDILEKIQRVLG